MNHLDAEIMAAMADGLEVVLIPVRMGNEDRTLKALKIRVIKYTDQETVSVCREIDIDSVKRSSVTLNEAMATELMVARTRIME